MVNQQYDGYDGAEKEEWVGTLVDREEPVKGNRHGCCAGKVHGIMYRKSWNHDGFEPEVDPKQRRLGLHGFCSPNTTQTTRFYGQNVRIRLRFTLRAHCATWQLLHDERLGKSIMAVPTGSPCADLMAVMGPFNASQKFLFRHGQG